MLEIHNLSYKIGNNFILNDISTSFEPGKINLIIGPNGAGKSTLIKLISGQITPSTGTIKFNGHEKLTNSEWSKKRAVLSQQIEIQFPILVEELILMGRYPHFKNKPSSKDYEIIDEVVSFLGIHSLLKLNFQTLSGGEKQRVHFARVIIQIWERENDRILILDEPLTFLDIHNQFELMYMLKELSHQKNLTIIGVIHDLNLTAKYADQIYAMKNGNLVKKGTKLETLNEEMVESIFGVIPKIIKDSEHFFITF